MKITKLTFYKEMKIGLPNYSNITASHGMEVDWRREKRLTTMPVGMQSTSNWPFRVMESIQVG